MQQRAVLVCVLAGLLGGCFTSYPADDPAQKAIKNHERAAWKWKDKGDHAKALSEYDAAIATPNANTWWLQDTYINRGMLLIEMGEFDRGLADVVKGNHIANNAGSRKSLENAKEKVAVHRAAVARDAYNADPKNINTIIALAKAEAEVLAFQKNENERLKAENEIGRLFDKALAIDSNSIPALKAKADYMVHNNDIYASAAQHVIVTVLNQSPGDAEAHYIYGMVLLRQGQMSSAVSAFTRALERDPTLWKANRGRCAALADKAENTLPSDCQLALADCEKWMAAEPDNVKAIVAHGDLNRYLHNDEAAIRDYYECTRLDPTDVESYGCIGQLLYRRDKKTPHVTECLVWYDKAIKTGKASAWIYFNRALARDHEGWYLAAREDWNEAKKLDPTYEEPSFSHSYAIFVAQCAKMDEVRSRQNARTAAAREQDEAIRKRVAEEEARAAAATPAPATPDDWATQFSNALKGYSPDQSAIQAGNANAATGAELQNRMDTERRNNDTSHQIERKTTGR